LGVIRDHFLAQYIPTDRLDIYYTAFRFPDLIFNVLILGAIAAAFVPIYSRILREDGNKKADEMASNALSIGLLIIFISLVVLFFIMPVLINLLVPDFDAAKRVETINLARWLLLSPLFFTVSYFLGGILNSHKRFFAYSIAPLIYNLSIIVCIYIFAQRFNVAGAVIGVIVGAFLHMLIQIPSAISVKFKFKPEFNFRDSNVQKVMKLMLPRAIGLGANQVLLLAFTSLASPFAGAIAIYNLADNIQTVPSVIFGSSFATAAFPTLAALDIEREREATQFYSVFEKSMRAILFLLVPSTAFLILLRAQVIRLILGYGFFGWEDTRLATGTLGLFALSIIAQGLIPLFARTFYAMHNTLTPMTTSIISIIISVVLGFIFSKGYAGNFEGVRGLALAFSIGSWANLIMLVIALSSKVRVRFKNLWSFLIELGVLTLIASLALQLVKIIVSFSFDIDRVKYLFLQTILAGCVGIIIFLGLAWVFRLPEVRQLKKKSVFF